MFDFHKGGHLYPFAIYCAWIRYEVGAGAVPEHVCCFSIRSLCSLSCQANEKNYRNERNCHPLDVLVARTFYADLQSSLDVR